MIAITGASGFIGGAVCATLRQQGRSVRRLVRRPVVAGEICFDLGAPDWQKSWPSLLEGCDAIVHCAAHVHRPIETGEERKYFSAINVIGTERLLAIAAAVSIKRFVFASTTAVYDWSHGPGARRETDRVAPTTAYGGSKLEAEQLVRHLSADWRIARLATVYGTGDIANFARLAVALRQQRFLLPGQGDARKSVLPICAAGEILAALAVRDDLEETVVNVAAPLAPSLAEICASFCDVCNFARPIRVPVPLLRSVGFMGDALQAVTGRAPFTTDMLSKLTTSTVVDCSKLQSTFPEQPWDSFRDSLKSFSGYYAHV